MRACVESLGPDSKLQCFVVVAVVNFFLLLRIFFTVLINLLLVLKSLERKELRW